MIVEQAIIDILAAGTVEENTYFLPQGQLDRKVYEAANKCLVNLGGKWNRKAKGHVFDYDPEDALSNLLLTGETEDLKKTFQFFPTPRVIAEELCDIAEISSASRVLEPSCGRGDLSDAIHERGASVHGIELNADNEIYLRAKPYPVSLGVDFLKFAEDVQNGKEDSPWDRIVMNPPFAKQQDIAHIYAAWSVLREGILVSIVSPSPFFRDNVKSVEFRRFLEENNAEVFDIPEGAFKESGTMIRTKIIKIKK